MIYTWIKKIFGINKVKTNEIIIPLDFLYTPPKRVKINSKRDFYRKHGFFESAIILNHNMELLDGYTSYLLAREFDLKYVTVFFDDGECD